MNSVRPKQKSIVWMIALTLVIGLGILLSCAIHWIASLEASHLRGVTKELASWEEEYSSLETLRDAELAAGMIDYVKGYYVPQEGLRADPETEGKLAEQRSRTLEAIRSALREFSGEDFGLDSESWLTWIHSRQVKENSSEQTGRESLQQ